MLRGCQKKIVFLKNTGSKIFDEAYFVISDKDNNRCLTEPDLVAEANRIIEENVLYKGAGEEVSLIRRLFKNRVIVFISGAVISLILCTVITLIV